MRDMVQENHEIFAACIIIRQDGAVAEAKIALELADPLHSKDVSA
jgi:hypothetical protein